MHIKMFYISPNPLDFPEKDKTYYWCAKASGDDHERYNRYLMDTFGATAQSQRMCDTVIDCIDAVTSGKEEYNQISGNGVSIEVFPAYIQVSLDFCDDWIDQPEGRFTHAEVRKIFVKWKEYLQLPESLDSVVEFEL